MQRMVEGVRLCKPVRVLQPKMMVDAVIAAPKRKCAAAGTFLCPLEKQNFCLPQVRRNDPLNSDVQSPRRR